MVALGQNGFQEPVSYSCVTFPLGLAIGDFNGDGYADLVVTDSDTNKMSVFLGNGDGTFKTPVSYTVTAAWTIAAVDFNGDGTFKTPVTYSVGPSPGSLTVADLNGDGKQDLVVAVKGSIYGLLGVGDGTFKTRVSYGVSGAIMEPFCRQSSIQPAPIRRESWRESSTEMAGRTWRHSTSSPPA